MWNMDPKPLRGGPCFTPLSLSAPRRGLAPVAGSAFYDEGSPIGPLKRSNGYTGLV